MPKESYKTGIERAGNKKAYDKEYRERYRYIFSINLSQDTDSDIIEALETYCGGNRQKAVKDLIRLGLSTLDIEVKCNSCKFREDTNIINPCLDCYDYSHYQVKDNEEPAK